MRLRRRTPEEREQRRVERALALGYRGTHLQPEVNLPPNAVLPSAAFRVPVPEGEGPRCPVCAGVAARGHQTWCPE